MRFVLFFGVPPSATLVAETLFRRCFLHFVVAVSCMESTSLTRAALSPSLVERRVLDLSGVVEIGLVHRRLKLPCQTASATA